MITPCSCSVPGCDRTITIMPFLTIRSRHDLLGGLCRDHLRLVDPDRRRVLRDARLEFRLSPSLAGAVLFQRAWRIVEAQAIERAGSRRAA
ncbi:hypothetical protein [Paradevosia shaoguanensis]|uniref:Uncharacterized protein n=1 Tax=Paradevosia shaoguanensis TaxID=1335043 RepID=A0AA41UDA1_9HYPH|nr:hypothetical protein [Paradevosia shaoguanensis]MCF1744634.1 hypothetical protein [Paradevosia shaoguanensis]MCI0129117.1 hypothetical protein [Paradevosia shaoguanensis]